MILIVLCPQFQCPLDFLFWILFCASPIITLWRLAPVFWMQDLVWSFREYTVCPVGCLWMLYITLHPLSPFPPLFHSPLSLLSLSTLSLLSSLSSSSFHSSLSLPPFSSLLSPLSPQQLQTDTVAYKTLGLPHFTPCSLRSSSSHISLGLYKHKLVLCRLDSTSFAKPSVSVPKGRTEVKQNIVWVN